MKRFIGFLRKEFCHIFRDKRTLLILFGMPIVQVILFGFAITNEIKNASISILDYSQDEVTCDLKDKILSSGYFELHENLYNEQEIEQSFRKGKIKEVIVFEKNFAERLQKEGIAHVQILTDATDPNTANTLSNYTTAILASYQETLNLNKELPVQITSDVRMLYNPEMKSSYMFVSGVMVLILTLVSALMTSVSITREKETGTLEVLMVSPLTPYQIILGKVMPYLLLSFINTLVILALGRFVFEVPINGSVLLLLFEGLLFILTALSLGILISTIANTQQTAMMMSMMGFMLPTMILSGFIFPLTSMPEWLQVFSHLIPAKWFLQAVKDIMLKGVGFENVWKETFVILGMTSFYLLISLKRFKLKLA